MKWLTERLLPCERVTERSRRVAAHALGAFARESGGGGGGGGGGLFAQTALFAAAEETRRAA